MAANAGRRGCDRETSISSWPLSAAFWPPVQWPVQWPVHCPVSYQQTGRAMGAVGAVRAAVAAGRRAEARKRKGMRAADAGSSRRPFRRPNSGADPADHLALEPLERPVRCGCVPVPPDRHSVCSRLHCPHASAPGFGLICGVTQAACCSSLQSCNRAIAGCNSRPQTPAACRLIYVTSTTRYVRST